MKKTIAWIIVMMMMRMMMMMIPEGEYEVNEEDNASDNCDHPKSHSGLRRVNLLSMMEEKIKQERQRGIIVPCLTNSL